MFNCLKRKITKQPINDYSHWDIHAMARVLDPEAWTKMDEAGIHPNNYYLCKTITPSFDMAVNALKHGVRLTENRLMSHDEVAAYFKSLNK